MAVVKSEASVISATGQELGRGTAYIHLPKGRERAQLATGTISLRSWNPGTETPTMLNLDSGPALPIEVQLEALSECSRNHILRYRAEWSPGESPPSTGAPTAP